MRDAYLLIRAASLYITVVLTCAAWLSRRPNKRTINVTILAFAWNVPAVLLWLPIAPRTAHPDFVWLVMAMSSTFAGNLTLIGSMANLIVAERASARGEHIGFVDYLKVGVPVTIATLLWGILWIVIFVR